MQEKIKVRIGSKLLCIYLIYIVAIWGFEAADCICYELNMRQTTVISRIGVLVILVVLLWKGRKYFEVPEMEINLKILVGGFVVIAIGCLKSVYADVSADTFNYHLIMQRPGFRNYFVEHFGKGFFQVYMFRLGDRLFTLFRRILGFRYGTLLSTVILLLCYLQIRNLLKEYLERKEENKNIVFKIFGSTELWALIIVLMHYNLLNVGSYNIDILSLPIGIEILRKMIETLNKEPSEGDIYYVASLSGIWFAFKMTNIVFVVPCVIMYVLLNRKHITLKRFLVSGLLAVIPCSIYLIVAFFDTGNPVFPFFNSLFQSPYFVKGNFKDNRWGGRTVKEKLFWLIYLVFRPEYRSSEISAEYTFVFAIGLLSIVLILLNSVIKVLRKKWRFDEGAVLAILTISSSFLWGFTTGYARYYMFGMTLLGILAFYILNYQSNKIMNAVISVVTIIALAEMGCTINHMFLGREWSWRIWSIDTFEEQCSKVFRDREFAENRISDVDMFFIFGSSGLAEMFDPEIYTYNANYNRYIDDISIAEEQLAVHGELLEGNVYGMISRMDMHTVGEYVDILNSIGMKIEEFQPWETTIGTIELVKISKQNDDPNKIIWEESINIKCEKNFEDAKIKFICGRIYPWETSPPYEMVVTNENGEILYKNWVDNLNIKTYIVDIGHIDEKTDVKIEFYDHQGNIADFSQEVNKVFVINPQFL